jgi:enoyl-CoA hydratase/carnithine racemase
MNFQSIKCDITDRILTITLNRPEKLNAVSHEMNQEIIAALGIADTDDNVRAVIMTGEGRAFCAGADLSRGAETFNHTARDDQNGGGSEAVNWSDPAIQDSGGKVALRIFECLKPVIAAINGPAVGQGLTMTLAMDFRLASESAKLGFVFSQRGIGPECCSTYFLPRLVGIPQALKWMYSGRVFDAEEALQGGLVQSVHSTDDLLPAARELALELTGQSAPVSVAMIRQMVWRLLGADHPMEAQKLESKNVYALGQLDDAREGVSSFLEKRAPEFSLKPSQDMPGFYPWWEERKFE